MDDLEFVSELPDPKQTLFEELVQGLETRPGQWARLPVPTVDFSGAWRVVIDRLKEDPRFEYKHINDGKGLFGSSYARRVEGV